jgi:hypothetical protein
VIGFSKKLSSSAASIFSRRSRRAGSPLASHLQIRGAFARSRNSTAALKIVSSRVDANQVALVHS